MKKIIVLLTLMACIVGNCDVFAVTKTKTSKQTESLKYDIFYHWGFIWKKAGQGTLTLAAETDVEGNLRMHGRIVGRSLSIVESLMAVRDTLDCWYTPDYVPIEFCKNTNEGSYKAIERNYYTSYYNGNGISKGDVDSTMIRVDRWRNKKGSDTKTHSVKGAAYDMLSAFYMVRGLDFSKMKPGTKFKIPVVAGIKLQWMTIKYAGLSTCKMRNDKKIQAYKVELAINTKGEDGAPLHVWLSKDSSHRPLSVTIQLRRIGAIQCDLVE